MWKVGNSCDYLHFAANKWGLGERGSQLLARKDNRWTTSRRSSAHSWAEGGSEGGAWRPCKGYECGGETQTIEQLRHSLGTWEEVGGAGTKLEQRIDLSYTYPTATMLVGFFLRELKLAFNPEHFVFDYNKLESFFRKVISRTRTSHSSFSLSCARARACVCVILPN